MRSRQCDGMVIQQDGTPYRCNRRATVHRDEQHFCGACDQVAIAKRKAKEAKGARVADLGAALAKLKHRLGEAQCYLAMHAMDQVMQAYAKDMDPTYKSPVDLEATRARRRPPKPKPAPANVLIAEGSQRQVRR